MPKFVYNSLFQFGKDDTKYDLVSKEGVSERNFDDKKLLFICEVGARSGLAAEYASSMGSDNSDLYNIDEGTSQWINQGLPHSKGQEK